MLHKSDGASAIKRVVYSSVVKPLHLRWLNENQGSSLETGPDNPLWFHIDETPGRDDSSPGLVVAGTVDATQKKRLPYFVNPDTTVKDMIQHASTDMLSWLLEGQQEVVVDSYGMEQAMGRSQEPAVPEPGNIDYYQDIYDNIAEKYVDSSSGEVWTSLTFTAVQGAEEAQESMQAFLACRQSLEATEADGARDSAVGNGLDYYQAIYDSALAEDKSLVATKTSTKTLLDQRIDIRLFFDGIEDPILFPRFCRQDDSLQVLLHALKSELAVGK